MERFELSWALNSLRFERSAATQFRHMTNIILKKNGWPIQIRTENATAKKLCVTIPSLVPLPRLELGSLLLSITFWVWRVYQFLHKGFLFEPMMGFEPTAYWLQISCTTIVLHWQKSEKIIQTVAITILKKKKMVGPSRFELKTQLPKSCVLPLHHRPIKNTITIVAEAGLEPARPLLTRRFSYHTCFYTSKLTFTYASKHPDLFLCAIVKPSSRILRSLLLYIHPTGKVLEYIS